MGVKFELPLETLEPLFNALNVIKPNHCTRLENKALGLLKSAIYFELEMMMETEEEAEQRAINFKTLFREQRERTRIKQTEHKEDRERITENA